MQGRAEARVRALKIGGAAAVVLAMVLPLLIVGCTQRTSAPVVSSPHPQVLAGQACSSCKAANHAYQHEKPFQGDCLDCHNLRSWTRVEYSHKNQDMNIGFHAVVGCRFCHTEKVPEPKPDCAGCHRPLTHPVIPKCANCHTPLAWRVQRALPAGHVSLVNGHAELTCFDCHRGATAFSAPRACVSCHGVKHGGLTDCGSCHDPALHWRHTAGFNHNRFFVLTGKHTKVACSKCHPANAFASARPQCVSCHGVKHGGLRRCYSCHTTRGFKPSTFVHSSVFRLRGAHATLACSKCHPSNRYASVIGSPSRCTNCHGVKHGGLTACASCHTTTSFKPSTFRHGSRWALTGQHATLACSKCHPSNRYASVIGSPSRCTNCHGVKHGNQTDCAKCHTTNGFSPAKRITHPVFPALGGEHAARACTLCHPTLVFNAPTRQCKECHTAPHIGPTDCLRCHRPTVWTDLHFAHSDIGYHTSYAIEDACLYCHTTGNYAVYECVNCHGPF